MSRVYTDDECTMAQAALWNANAERAFKGKKGQRFFREVERALLAMPVKELHTGYLHDGDHVCVLGAVAVQREIDKGLSREQAMKAVPFSEDEAGARATLKLSRIMAWEFMYQNDGSEDYPSRVTPAQRWEQLLKWIRRNIVETS